MFNFWRPRSDQTRNYTRGAKIRKGKKHNCLHAKKGQSFYSLRYLNADNTRYIIGLYTKLEDMPGDWKSKYFVEHWKPNMNVVLNETMWMEDFHALKHAKMKDGIRLLVCWGMDGDTRPMQELHQQATGKEWCFKHFGKCPAGFLVHSHPSLSHSARCSSSFALRLESSKHSPGCCRDCQTSQ